MKKHLIVIKPMRYFLLLLLGAASAFAQQPAARVVRLRLLAFDSTAVPTESYVFDPAVTEPSPGIVAPIKGYLNHEDLKLQLFGSDLIFSKSKKAEDAKNAELQIGKVTLPKTGNRFMLIFLPGANQQFRVLPLDDSVKEFPLGSYRVISLSRFPVRLTLEKNSYEFKPGQSSLITDPPVQANHHSAMYAYATIDGKEQRIGSGLWPHPGQKRAVQVFFDNPTSQAVELRGFRDISPPSASSATAETTSP